MFGIYASICVIFGGVLLIYSVGFGPTFLSALLLLIAYAVTLITLFVFLAVHLHRRRKTDTFPIKLALFKLLIWLPFLVSLLVLVFGPPESYMYFFVPTLIIALLSPAEQLVLACCWDRDYRAAMGRVIRCKGEGAEDLAQSAEEGAVTYKEIEQVDEKEVFVQK